MTGRKWLIMTLVVVLTIVALVSTTKKNEPHSPPTVATSSDTNVLAKSGQQIPAEGGFTGVPAEDREPQKPEAQEQTGILQLIVQDREGRSLEGAQVRPQIRRDAGKPRQTNFDKSYTTDVNGVAEVAWPLEGLSRLEVDASKDDYGSRKMVWDLKTGDAVPSNYTIKLGNGINIGGFVVDPEGNPISGATVSLNRFWSGGEEIRNKGEEAEFPTQKHTTVSDGRWSAHNLPPELLGRIFVNGSHPDFVGTNITVGGSPEIEKQLRAGTHKLVLMRGLGVHGLVTDEQNQPIAGATVWAGRKFFPGRQQTKSDDQGRFVFRGVNEGDTLFSVMATGHKPDNKSYQVHANMEEIVFRLGPGNVIRARVQNEAGEPLSGARVALEGNPGEPAYDAYEFSASTDSDGKFGWDSAPDEPMSFYVFQHSFEAKRHVKLPPNQDNMVTLRRSRQLQGNVLDASTEQPVTRFHVRVGRNTPGVSSLYGVIRQSDFTSPDGRFTMDLDEEEHNAVEISGDDYANQTQSLPEPHNGVVEVVFRLKPDSALEGVVIAPDGQPVPGADVAAVQPGPGGKSVTLVNGRLRRSDPQAKVVTTDDSGHFRIPSPPDDGTVVAANGAAFASASIAQVRSQGVLTLQLFGRIEGELKTGTAPGVGQELLLTSSSPMSGIYFDFSGYKATSDSNGRFAFEQVPPCKVSIVRLIKTTPNSWTHSHSTDVTVEPDKTTQVTLGGTGATLQGHVSFETPPAADARFTINGQLSSPPSGNYFAIVGIDGSLTLDSIPPGEYTLHVTATVPGTQPYLGQPIARGEMTVTIPAEANPASPINLGEIILKPTPKP